MKEIRIQKRAIKLVPIVLSGHSLLSRGSAAEQQHTSAAPDSDTQQARASDEFVQVFEEAYTSALTKFDSLESYFASGMGVLEVYQMLATEMQSDKDFSPSVDAPEHNKEFQIMLKRIVGRAYSMWKKCGGDVERVQSRFKDNPLPWSSIDSYPDWVMSQIGHYTDAAPEEKEAARKTLEHTLLEKPLCAATIKYDGTCFGKLGTGDLVGRKQILGASCQEYQRTITTAAATCNVQALGKVLSDMLCVDISCICIWGELMCNPGFYDYKSEACIRSGFASASSRKWVCRSMRVACCSS
jgi:hypothetical protein